MNYCKKSGKHWKCIANSARSQRKCAYFAFDDNNQFCRHDNDGTCHHVLARSFASRESQRESS